MTGSVDSTVVSAETRDLERLQQHIDDLERRHAFDRALITTLQHAERAAREQIANLETALSSSRRIGAAIGILMAQHRVTDDEAFTLLRTASQLTHRKIRDLADDVVLTGTLPVPDTGHAAQAVSSRPTRSSRSRASATAAVTAGNTARAISS